MNELKKTIFKIYEENGFDSVEQYFNDNEKLILKLSQKELEEVYYSLIRLGLINQKLEFAKKLQNRVSFESSNTTSEKFNLLNEQLTLLKKNKKESDNQISSILYKIPSAYKNDKGVYDYRTCLLIENFYEHFDAVILFDDVESKFSNPNIQAIKYWDRWRNLSSHECQNISSRKIQELLPDEFINKSPALICTKNYSHIEDSIPINETLCANYIRKIDDSTSAIIIDIGKDELLIDEVKKLTGISELRLLSDSEKNIVMRKSHYYKYTSEIYGVIGDYDYIVNCSKKIWRNYFRRKYGIQER